MMEYDSNTCLAFLKRFMIRELGQKSPPKFWRITKENGQYRVQSDQAPEAANQQVDTTDVAVLEKLATEFDPFEPTEQNVRGFSGPGFPPRWLEESDASFESHLNAELDIQFQMSRTVRIRDAQVAIGIGWAPEDHEKLCALSLEVTRMKGGLYFHLIDSALTECLSLNKDKRHLFTHTYDELNYRIKRRGVEEFLEDLMAKLDWKFSEELLAAQFSELASSKYESNPLSCALRLLTRDEEGRALLRIQHPVRLSNRPLVRKILETGILHGEDGVSPGLFNSEIGSLHQFDRSKHLHVLFPGDLSWELRYGEQPVLSYRDGDFLYPKSIEPFEQIRKFAAAAFDNEVAIELSLQVADWMNSIRHGGLVAIIEDPTEDCARLCVPGMLIKDGSPISQSILVALTKPDGAVIIDTLGAVRAFGVILDGKANAPMSDPARGARYHSAIRFMLSLEADERKAIAFLKSEDRGLEVVTQDGRVHAV